VTAQAHARKMPKSAQETPLPMQGEKSVPEPGCGVEASSQARRVLAGVKILTLVNLFCLSPLGKRNL